MLVPLLSRLLTQLSPEANLEFAETLRAMISPHALYERKPYMVVKLCVPVACCALAFMSLACIAEVTPAATRSSLSAFSG